MRVAAPSAPPTCMAALLSAAALPARSGGHRLEHDVGHGRHDRDVACTDEGKGQEDREVGRVGPQECQAAAAGREKGEAGQQHRPRAAPRQLAARGGGAGGGHDDHRQDAHHGRDRGEAVDTLEVVEQGQDHAADRQGDERSAYERRVQRPVPEQGQVEEWIPHAPLPPHEGDEGPGADGKRLEHPWVGPAVVAGADDAEHQGQERDAHDQAADTVDAAPLLAARLRREHPDAEPAHGCDHGRGNEAGAPSEGLDDEACGQRAERDAQGRQAQEEADGPGPLGLGGRGSSRGRGRGDPRPRCPVHPGPGRGRAGRPSPRGPRGSRTPR